MRLVVGGLDLGGDPTTVGDLVAIGPSPFPNRSEIGSLRPARAGGAATTATPPAAATRVSGPWCQCVAQFLRILVAEVNLVRDPVEREGEGFFGVTAVNIVDQDDFDSEAKTAHGRNAWQSFPKVVLDTNAK